MRRWIALFSITLAGCATGTPVWWSAVHTQQQADRDHYECRRDSTYVSGQTWTVFPTGRGGLVPVPLGGSGPELDMNLFTACMNAKGYTLTYR